MWDSYTVVGEKLKQRWGEKKDSEKVCFEPDEKFQK